MIRILLTLIFLISLAYVSSAQASKYQLKTNTSITKHLDPGYPKYVENDANDPDHKKWRKAMDIYADKHSPYPMYVNSGDVGTDENNFAFEIEAWFMRNPYYPQYIDTGNPTADLSNWNKAKSEWCKRYPEVCKEVNAAQQ